MDVQSQPQANGGSTPPGPSPDNEIKALWVGDLPHKMDNYGLLRCFSNYSNEIVSAKVIQNYGFIEFISRSVAEDVLRTLNGQMMPNNETAFRLNWATFGLERKRDGTPEHTIFVGDLAVDVTDVQLREFFSVHFPSVEGAKVVMDRTTGRSRGYGFVTFGDENEKERAMTEMNGVLLSTRPVRIGQAVIKCRNNGLNDLMQQQRQQHFQGNTSDSDDLNNKTVFVGGLSQTVTNDDLMQLFDPYGEIVSVRILAGKRCGFVEYSERYYAKEAIEVLDGTSLGGQNIRLSWGRPANKPDQYAAMVQGSPSYTGYGPLSYNGINDIHFYGQTNGYGPPPPPPPPNGFGPSNGYGLPPPPNGYGPPPPNGYGLPFGHQIFYPHVSFFPQQVLKTYGTGVYIN